MQGARAIGARQDAEPISSQPPRARYDGRVLRHLAAAPWPFLLLLACMPFCGACADTKDERPDIVVVVMDTARPDYLSVYGHPRGTSPFLEEFARSGTVYDRAYSTSCWTLPAHASLFTGAAPQKHGATQTRPSLGPELPVLAEELAAAGYRTGGFSANAWVSKTSGLARGFEVFEDRWRRTESPDAGPDVHPTVVAVRDWLSKEDGRPEFLFVNLIEPHMPFKPSWEHAAPFFAAREAWRTAIEALFPSSKPPSFLTVRHYAGKDPISKLEWEWMRALYEGDLRQTDAVVGALVKAVDARRRGRETLVFVLSDHGENLGDHGHVSHVFNLYDSNLRIALLARGPGFAAGARESKLAGIRDLHPTILKAAGAAHAQGAGHDALDLRAPLPEQRLLAAALDYPRLSLETFPDEIERGKELDPWRRELEAAISARWKLIRGSDGSCEAFDLLEDPREERPVPCARLDQDTRRALEAWLDLQKAQTAAGAGPAAAPADAATRDALRALGYVE